MLQILLVFGLLMCSLNDGNVSVSALKDTTGTHMSTAEYRAKEYLRKLEEATLHVVESPDGDVIHCVHRARQPAFDHPLLKDHVLQVVCVNRQCLRFFGLSSECHLIVSLRQEAPSSIPKNLDMHLSHSMKIKSTNSSTAYSLFGSQLWHSRGQCPEKTVPIRRPSVNDLVNDTHSEYYHQLGFKLINIICRSVLDVHQYATTQVDHTSIYGTSAVFNAWKPAVVLPIEMSIAQLWLVSGTYSGTNLNTIEAGWMRDYYKATGCLNLNCPGFVQVTHEMLLGGTIAPMSTYRGKQFDVQPVIVWKPAVLLANGLQEKASIVQWGGEITNSFIGNQHTSTQMGSGHFPTEGFSRAAYVRSLKIVDSSYSLVDAPRPSVVYTTNSKCYSISPFFNPSWGRGFFFGGPGLNANCK
ncbi:hypothetical protein KP509_04G080800 [Ceratopteris richardii]|uniref:Neprosin PEP catalytic domain-containing protein n=1 Tax=Ceratopteris richardii TaxID=49495 RepID=A0A8T2UXE0_CERRI|nr:hypothetical protein KP509_04G080800 [Ceratopteris richardii]